MMEAKFTRYGCVVPLVAKEDMSAAGIGLGFFLLLAVALIAAPDPRQTASPEVAWDEKVEVASGKAFRGPWRMNESEFHYVDDPTVAINQEGVVGVAWADQARRDILFQIYEPNGEQRLKEPVNVSSAISSSLFGN